MKNVSFAYRGARERLVLDGVNVVFERGKLVALTGRTGAGKTTLVELIERLFQPTAGVITADGIDIREFPLAEWRRQIGYVSQDAFLFNASIRENITLFRDSITDEEVRRSTHLAQLDEFIAGLPDGLDTLIGERGVQLSGGQRQRIVIARSIVRKPRILILDEATSALDNLTERAFQSAMNELRRESILIIIAHRLSSVEGADEILVLHEGKVVERGKYQELLHARGRFWSLQHAVAASDGASRDPAAVSS